jgi:hypothetical protein
VPDAQEGHEEEPRTQQKKKKSARAKRSFVLTDVEEEDLIEWIAEKEFLWNSRMKDFCRTDKKGALWEEQAIVMGKTPEVLQGWWQGIKDQFTKLHKKKSGQAAPVMTERQHWIVAHCQFLERIVRHKGASVRPVSKKK